MGPADRACPDGMQRIATERLRNKYDRVIVQEKLDGTNVGVAKVEGQIYAIQRAGYPAESSPYEQHHHFAAWVCRNEARFACLLENGERICGEWHQTQANPQRSLRTTPKRPMLPLPHSPQWMT